MKMLHINPEKCVGCKLCELTCSFHHFGEFNPSISFISNADFQDEPFFFLSMTCLQCESPYCMEICPAKAISRDEKSGIISVSKDRCRGCKMCTLACPFGNIIFLEKEGVAGKCDLCGGDPECVKICPTGAIEYLETSMGDLTKKRAFSENFKKVYHLRTMEVTMG